MVDFADVKGQGAVKRALESAAAGGHNLLMIGPPGSGKTMMARRVPTILPGLNFDESVEVTKIYSVAGLVKEKGALISARPFRSPHHTISYAALTGGGHVPKPGEISLSHKGVLFLDELPEFPKSVLEMLRQPMEDGRVTVSRVGGTFDYPTEFMLIASMNPCPCGYYPDTERCACSGRDVARYLSRLSGPLLDRIDIQIEAPRVRYEELGHGGGEESSSGIKARVARAREIQLARQGRLNAQLSARQTETFCRLSPKGGKLLKSAFEVMGLSARAYHKIIKTARTLADLDGETDIMPEHVSEAVGYRSLDRRYWR
jgi:magnesium chelatase family protein